MKYIAWLLKAAIFFTLFAFALNNQQDATVHFFFGTQWTAPLVLVVSDLIYRSIVLQGYEGIVMAKQDRYALMDEDVSIMKALWTARGPVEFALESRTFVISGSAIAFGVLNGVWHEFHLTEGGDQGLSEP